MQWIGTAVKCGALLVLVASGTNLRNQFALTWSQVQAQRGYLSTDPRLALSSIVGIDLAGRRVLDIAPDSVDRWIVFRLRSASLHEDIEYWTAVAAAIPKGHRLGLLGYCERSDCRDSLALRTDGLPFRVVVYGEVIASQAVANADAEGEYIVLNQERRRLRRGAWRSPDSGPSATAEEITR